MIVRHAGLEDARAIAAIHVRSWQVAYQRLVPPAVLAALSIDGREQTWRQALEQRSAETWVAEEDGSPAVRRRPQWAKPSCSRSDSADNSPTEIHDGLRDLRSGC